MISMELQKYIIDIAALSEERWFSESASIREETLYIFYWRRKTSTEPGVAFAVKNRVEPSISEYPKPGSNRLITLKFPLVDSSYFTLILLIPLL